MAIEIPLPRKLGIKQGNRVLSLGAPDDVELGDMPDEVRVDTKLGLGPYAVALLFVTERADLEDKFGKVRARITPQGCIWVCFPRQGLDTDLNEAVAQSVSAAQGLGDTRKVIELDGIWSALRCSPERKKAAKAKA